MDRAILAFFSATALGFVALSFAPDPIAAKLSGGAAIVHEAGLVTPAGARRVENVALREGNGCGGDKSIVRESGGTGRPAAQEAGARAERVSRGNSAC